jgi:hypothetical protein
MDISSYRNDAVLGLRDPAREPYKSAVSPISAVTRQTAEIPQDEGLSFFDTVLDTVNPLQHIPGVSSVYQSATGDKSGALANIAGGFLFGGPVGMAAGAATSFLEMLTGKDPMDHVMSFFNGEDENAGALAAGHVKTGETDPRDPLLQQTKALGLEHYQVYAEAQAAQNKGYGADTNVVQWNSNTWTDNALRGAAGLYDTNQKLGDNKTVRHQDTVI